MFPKLSHRMDRNPHIREMEHRILQIHPRHPNSMKKTHKCQIKMKLLDKKHMYP
jgi:hypothetical protein